MSDMEPLLAGKSLIVVEDEPLLAFDLVDILQTHGGRTIGPYQSLRDAMASLDRGEGRIDCAILDINLGGEEVWPLVDRLSAQGTPVIFVSAMCGSEAFPEQYSHHACLSKPLCKGQLRDALVSALVR